ncbi:cysteine-rich receptor-like protein kinase 15 isoform X2 [Cryptomeria japonica]|uniref:cysteine-rich receptor-like protein kinase 15 isoform X2 n=1 Tax=Cryptomeria japonica TaxID=3369 RepID=UPI0027DA4937|nr:cysteine-rich receptor-like protein kinase 15 isoform X2 [Cryptomeria japonica]
MFLPLLFLMIFPFVLCEYRWSICDNSSTYTEGSAYSTNLDRVMSDLSRNAPQSSGFNTSSRGPSPNKVYGLLQCLGYISAANCSNCFMEANSTIQELCANDVGGRVWIDNCFLRYDNSNFISTLDTNFALLENTKSVTNNIQDFKSTTSGLLSNLSDKAYTAEINLFAVGSANYSTSHNIYGLVQCWRDISINDCKSCLFQARKALEQCCSSRQGAQAMSGSCTVRYEIYPFVDSGKPDASFSIINNSKDFSGNIQSFKSTTSSLLSSMSFDLANYPPYKDFVMTEPTKYSNSDEVIGLVRCSSDLSKTYCSSCLLEAKQLLESCCSSKESAQVTSKSCMVGYHVHKISDPEAPTTSPTSTPSPPVDRGRANPPSQAKSKKSSKRLPMILGITIGVILIFVACSLTMLRKLKPAVSMNPATLVKHNEERRLFTKEQIAFSLETLIEATQDFSDNNKLGEGGFGPVYKGTTSDGKEIAVKKLSARSAQGKREFMNEVELVANIQHRNLVNLLGCCSEETERMLVYEYMPNKSLDTFLFDPVKRRTLDWQKRFNIIIGLARGLLYLHEDSQLRIIHRDIKAGNILLDENLNPKIADFGLARLFSDNETEIQSRVAGTYGYMAPEYAMGGQLSVKADVYSFGVLLLELVSGRKNTDMYLSKEKQSMGLLEWAWRLFKGGHALKILDIMLAGSCPEEQVIRCIHIGLLCTQADPDSRPMISSVVTMISSNSVPLPDPTRPAYVSMSSQSPNVSFIPTISSRNEISTSELEPR